MCHDYRSKFEVKRSKVKIIIYGPVYFRPFMCEIGAHEKVLQKVHICHRGCYVRQVKLAISFKVKG